MARSSHHKQNSRHARPKDGLSNQGPAVSIPSAESYLPTIPQEDQNQAQVDPSLTSTSQSGSQETESQSIEAPLGIIEASPNAERASQMPPNYEQLALDAINQLAERDQKRAEQRYGKTRFGKLRRWFNQEGERTKAECLEQAGTWKQNEKWKKWLRIGAKVSGGMGAAAAMVFTGGAGLFLTPLIWSVGMREGIDGVLEAIEELKWGANRTRAELGVQEVQTETIEQIKSQVSEGNLTPESFSELLNQLALAENDVVEQQLKNFKQEKRGALIRGLISSASTVAVGMFAGVPTGHAQFKGLPTELGSNLAPGSGHSTFWNMHGASFTYNNPTELTQIAQKVIEQHGQLHAFSNGYGLIGHALGHGLDPTQYAGLVSAGAYLAGRNIVDWVANRRSKEGFSPDSCAVAISGQDQVATYPESNETPPPQIPTTPQTPENLQINTPTSPEQQLELQKEQQAIDEYFQNYDPNEKEILDDAVEQTKPMHQSCRLAVCIPVAYNEPNLVECLNAYLEQIGTDPQNQVEPNQVEINLFINGPESKIDEVKQRMREAGEFKRVNPGVNLNVIGRGFDQPRDIGQIRKIVNDFAILRSRKRDYATGSLVIVTQDADTFKHSKGYLRKGLGYLDSDPDLEIVAGRKDYSETTYQEYPYLLATRRFWQYLDIVNQHYPIHEQFDANGNLIKREKKGCIPKAEGNNTFVRARSYAEVGGYPSAEVAEDLMLGYNIVRKSGKQSIAYKPTVVYVDPRRDLDAIKKGWPLIRAYDKFHNNHSVRNPMTADEVKGMAPSDPRFLQMLNTDIEEFYNHYWRLYYQPRFDAHPSVIAKRARGESVEALYEDLKLAQIGQESLQELNQVFSKAMEWWGADYNVVVDAAPQLIMDPVSQNYLPQVRAHVQITNWDKLRQGLENFLARP